MLYFNFPPAPRALQPKGSHEQEEKCFAWQIKIHLAREKGFFRGPKKGEEWKSFLSLGSNLSGSDTRNDQDGNAKRRTMGEKSFPCKIIERAMSDGGESQVAVVVVEGEVRCSA